MPQILTPERLLEALPADGLVYIPGASGAPNAFTDRLLADTERTRGLRMFTTYVPGINPLRLDQLHPTACVTGLFMQPMLAQAQRAGRYRALPQSYAGFVRYLDQDIDIGLTVVQVSPPDAAGRCSLGPAVEFMPIALRKSRRVLGIVNRQTPRIPGAPTVALNDFDCVCEVDAPLPTYQTVIDETTQAIARHIAPLVRDGDALQTGLGKVPISLSGLLCDRRGLRLHSGMLSDALMALHAAGALDASFRHATCAIVGSPALYEWCADHDVVQVAGCEHTHDPRTLAGIDRFVAINSALQVDLFGQCNLEHAEGQAISSAGGAPDFARAARLSRGGRSIVALNATYRRGEASRIVPCLPEQAIATLPRTDVDHVVTEFGVAQLEGLSVHERAQALIGVAAPQFRDELQRAWQAIAARL